MNGLFIINYRIILVPLVGCLIGYITNDLAIKMLFRPRKSVYIGKWHIPFTPGLIPQQKSRIAASIGRVISMQLLNFETIKETILSEKTLLAIEENIKNFFELAPAVPGQIFCEGEGIHEYRVPYKKNYNEKTDSGKHFHNVFA